MRGGQLPRPQSPRSSRHSPPPPLRQTPPQHPLLQSPVPSFVGPFVVTASADAVTAADATCAARRGIPGRIVSIYSQSIKTNLVGQGHYYYSTAKKKARTHACMQFHPPPAGVQDGADEGRPAAAIPELSLIHI